MKMQRAVWAAFPALGVVCAAMSQETVKLEYKLRPGMELTYKLSGTVKMSFGQMGDMQGTFAGVERFVVADVDAATGEMLIGQLPTIKISMNVKTAEGEQTKEQILDEVSVCRTDRAGNHIVRKPKDEAKLQFAVRAMLHKFDHQEFSVVPLPAGAVAVGATWEGVTDAVSPQFPASAKIVSTLADVKTIDGRRCAVIKSKLSSSDKKPTGDEPKFDVSGDVEMLFDIEGGFARRVTSKADLKVSATGETMNVRAEMTSAIDSMKTLPPQDAAREAKVIRTFDAATASLYAGEYAKATETLESLEPADLPGAWQAGFSKALGTVQAIAEESHGGPPMPQHDPAISLFAEAEKAAQQKNWADAIAKYKELVEKYPDHPLANLAGRKAAGLCEEKLRDKKSADELRQQLVATQEKRAAANPMELRKLGEIYEDLEKPEKAVAAYRKFLAAEGLIVSSAARLLAQYRIGVLLEQLGKTAEATEAYKAVAAMAGDDAFAKQLKDQAQKKVAALAATPAK